MLLKEHAFSLTYRCCRPFVRRELLYIQYSSAYGAEVDANVIPSKYLSYKYEIIDLIEIFTSLMTLSPFSIGTYSSKAESC